MSISDSCSSSYSQYELPDSEFYSAANTLCKGYKIKLYSNIDQIQDAFLFLDLSQYRLGCLHVNLSQYFYHRPSLISVPVHMISDIFSDKISEMFKNHPNPINCFSLTYTEPGGVKKHIKYGNVNSRK